MNHHPIRQAAFTALLSLATATAWAGPGAHGPNGEHLDGDAATVQPGSAGAPRMETHSEDFELVATLSGGELSILIDRFATNEPVLGAEVEVQAGQAKAVAAFHADHGDYAVADAGFVKALASPGEHALVVTLSTGKESDLLDGVLKVDAAVADTAHGPGRTLWWAGGAVLAGAAGALVWWLARRRRTGSGSVA